MLVNAEAMFRGVIVVWIVIVVVGWTSGGPLGHDEAAYAIGADAALDGGASPWLYRSPGMHVLASFGVLAGGSELALRLPAMLIAIAFLFALRRAGDAIAPGAGVWAAASIIGMHAIALRGHELLSDLPATTCTLAAIAIAVAELRRDDGPRWRIVLVAPLLAAAFYVRYATALPIALICALAAIAWWRSIAKRPLPVVATAAALAVLAIPHVVHAIDVTGSPTGILALSAGVPRRDYVGEGLVSYLAGNPFVVYGALSPLLVFGLVAVRRRDRAIRFAWGVAVGQIVGLGLLSHGQPRYIFVALALLCILGVAEIARVFDARRRAIALAVVGAAALGTLAATIVRGARDDWRTPIPEAAEQIRRDAGGRPCEVVSRRFAQLMWYTGCRRGGQEPDYSLLDRGHAIYCVWLDRTPGIPDRDDIAARAPAPLDLIDVAREDRYVVTRIERRAPGVATR
jgi:hypothetical protein